MVTLAASESAFGRKQKKVGTSIAKYWKAKFAAFGESEAVKDAAPLMGSAVNVAITGLVLRIFLPRLAALNAVGGFDELAEFFGIPPRDDLIGYLDQINGQPMIAIFGIYVLLFFAEKVTMTDEFLPIGFVLPVLSPMVFGNVLNGTVLTSLASTIAASANFWLGRTVLRESSTSNGFQGRRAGLRENGTKRWIDDSIRRITRIKSSRKDSNRRCC